MKDRSVLISVFKVRAERRALFSAVLAGAGLGLAVGALYLASGMGRIAADHAEAQRIAEAVSQGYAGVAPDAGDGLTLGVSRYGGLSRYGLRPGADTVALAARFAAGPNVGRPTRAADLECMTQAVYYEARGEGSRGQAAVAQVVMNRLKHPAFPKSVCAVVFQGAHARGCQFSFACDGSMRHHRDFGAWSEARAIASRALAGVVVANIGAATHFHTTAVSPSWAPQMLRVSQVGVHVFYRFGPHRMQPLFAERAVLISTPTVPSELKIAPALVETAIAASLSDPAPAPSPEPVASKATEADGPVATKTAAGAS